MPSRQSSCSVISKITKHALGSVSALVALRAHRNLANHQPACVQGFYDRKGQYWKDVDDTLLLAACAPAGGDRQRISTRFTRHFALLCMPPPPAAAISAILSAVLSDFLAAAPRGVAGMGPALVAASVQLYGRLTTELLPTPAKSHYTFNLRDLSSLFHVRFMSDKLCPSAQEERACR